MKKNTLKFLCIIFIISQLPFSGFAQGCVEASSDEGPQLVGYIQPQFNAYFFGSKDNGDAIKPNTFLFKRARIGVVGSIPYDISYYVMAEFAPAAGGPQLLDAFVTYAPLGKYAKFSLGQFKSPFSLELNTPCQALHTINRSTVVNNLASPFRELGFMVLGAVGKERDIFKYKVAILNGTGINNLDDNNNKDIAGRIAVLPLEWLEIGGSYRTGFYGTQTKDSTGAWAQRKRKRTAFDLTIKKWNFLLQGEYLIGKDIGEISSGGGCGGKSTSDGALPVYDKDGFWIALMYTTPWSLEAIVKYETYNPDGTAYTYLGEPQTFDQSTITFGLNYFLNDWTRIQVNYLYNAEGKTNGVMNEYDNDAFMIQVQAKF
jgi:hypothetical protein